MTDNLRTSLEITFSEQANFSDPEWTTNWANFDLTPEGAETRKLEIGTGAETIDLGDYSAITQLAVKNEDPTNYVTATFRSVGNGAVDNILRIQPNSFLVVSDVTPGSDLILQANGAPVLVKIAIAGET